MATVTDDLMLLTNRSFSIAALAIDDPTIRAVCKRPLTREKYNYICWLIDNTSTLSRAELIKALNTLELYKDELNETIRKYQRQLCALVNTDAVVGNILS